MIVPRYGAIHRGVEVFVRELINNMDKEFFRVTILSGAHGQSMDGVEMVEMPLIERDRIAKRLFPLLSRFPGRWHLGPAELEALTLMLQSRIFLQSRSFDVVMPFGGTWTYRFAQKYRHGARIVSVGHGGPVSVDLAASDCFVALTPADELLARSLRHGIETTVIPNGVDSVRFSCADKMISRPRSIRTVLCAAALTADKRHDLLFDAVMRLDDAVRVVCSGEGPLMSSLMRHPLYGQGRVEFVSKAYDEMAALYRSADVFSLASPDEAFGLVFLEALATGLPVVANDGPRQRFVVGETGFFCDVRDPAAYALVLKRALDAPPDDRRILHASRFCWASVAVQYQELFLRLVRGR